MVMISSLSYHFLISQNACFLFLNKTNKRKTNKHILARITHKQMYLFVQYWRILDLYTKILNVIPYTLWDKIFNLTLKFELDLTIFVQILEVSPQFQHNTVHIASLYHYPTWCVGRTAIVGKTFDRRQNVCSVSFIAEVPDNLALITKRYKGQVCLRHSWAYVQPTDQVTSE